MEQRSGDMWVDFARVYEGGLTYGHLDDSVELPAAPRCSWVDAAELHALQAEHESRHPAEESPAKTSE